MEWVVARPWVQGTSIYIFLYSVMSGYTTLWAIYVVRPDALGHN